jgi:hypothetical protein
MFEDNTGLTFSFACIVKLRLFRTGASTGEYLRYNLSNVITPSDGHDFGGCLSELDREKKQT